MFFNFIDEFVDFLANNLTLYNTNQAETGYEKNDFSMLYISGFDNCAMTSVTMRNIYSP